MQKIINVKSYSSSLWTRSSHVRLNNNASSQRGQTLVEVIVAVGVTAVLVTGLIVATTAGVHGSQVSTYKSTAVKFAQEAIEVARTARDTSWTSFSAMTGLWCLDDTHTWTQAAGLTCPINVDNFYSRGVTFTLDGTGTQMTVDATVSWTDGNGTHTSENVTYLTQWK